MKRLVRPIAALAGLLSALAAGYGAGQHGLMDTLLLLTLIVSGLPVLLQTGRETLHGRFATDVVTSLAIIGAAATQEYLAGCVIVLMQTGGEALEEYAVNRASASLEALLCRAPRIAHRLVDGKLDDVAVSAILIGDRVLVQPGEMVPVDGVVTSGISAVDELVLTGEPVPRTAGVGAGYCAETLSGTGGRC